MNWDDVGMARRRQLAERVDAGDLARSEQETSIDFFGDADDAKVTTYAPAVARALLKHPHARIDWVYAAGVRDHLAKVSDPAAIPDPARGVRIEGVSARIPLGILSVKGTPRNRNRPSGIVTVPKERDGREDGADTEADQ